MNPAGSGRILAFAGALLLAGCASDNTVYYAPPPGLAPDQAVSILGSKDPKFFLQSSEYHLVWAVDGLTVKDSAWRWNQPLLVTAGAPHRLSIAYGWGGIAGGTDIEFTGRPGSTVVVEGEAVDPDKLARLWLADAATGKIIGDKQPVALSWFPSPPSPLNTDEIVLRVIDKTVPR
jgi:hypothetical protein